MSTIGRDVKGRRGVGTTSQVATRTRRAATARLSARRPVSGNKKAIPTSAVGAALVHLGWKGETGLCVSVQGASRTLGIKISSGAKLERMVVWRNRAVVGRHRLTHVWTKEGDGQLSICSKRALNQGDDRREEITSAERRLQGACRK